MTEDNRSRAGAHLSHGMPGGDARALKISAWLTGVYFLIELGIGVRSGSVAVISDALHTFSAVGGILIALVAGYYARRPASQYSSFGLIRAEIIGALFNGLFLAGMAVLVLWMGTMRLRSPVEIPPLPMLVAAGGGLVTEVISLWLLVRRQRENLNIRGAFWHIIQTFVGSLLIIVAALVIRFTGFYAIDAILGMAFGLVLFWASWSIIRDATRILLDAVPTDLDLQLVVRAIEEIDSVLDVHHAHAWALTTGKNIVSMHVRVDELTRQEELLHTVHRILRERFSVYFSTVQIETECLEAGETTDIDYRQGRPEEQD